MVEQRKRAWTVTPWQCEAPGRWVGIAPCILVEGEPPFQAEHPAAYIAWLRELHDSRHVERGPFHARIGEFLDALENQWGESCVTP